jgi:hypothetical protein
MACPTTHKDVLVLVYVMWWQAILICNAQAQSHNLVYRATRHSDWHSNNTLISANIMYATNV